MKGIAPAWECWLGFCLGAVLPVCVNALCSFINHMWRHRLKTGQTPALLVSDLINPLLKFSVECTHSFQLQNKYYCLKELFWSGLYLCKPQEILHERVGVGIFHLHYRNLIFRRHQHIVVSVHYCCQVQTSEFIQKKRSIFTQPLLKSMTLFLKMTYLFKLLTNLLVDWKRCRRLLDTECFLPCCGALHCSVWDTKWKTIC